VHHLSQSPLRPGLRSTDLVSLFCSLLRPDAAISVVCCSQGLPPVTVLRRLVLFETLPQN
jgi:hypothetical protein